MKISVVEGDITREEVDAVVNAANSAMRGGGGVDGAIHRAGGPEVLEDCIRRFPHGLETGHAGWTTAGRMRARWVDASTWWSLSAQAGQQLFYPPDVGGWDDTRWLDTGTFRARWFIAALVQGNRLPAEDSLGNPIQYQIVSDATLSMLPGDKPLLELGLTNGAELRVKPGARVAQEG